MKTAAAVPFVPVDDLRRMDRDSFMVPNQDEVSRESAN